MEEQFKLVGPEVVQRFFVTAVDKFDPSCQTCQIVMKLCNKYQLKAVRKKEMPSVEVQQGKGSALLRSFLIFDEDDVNMQGLRKDGSPMCKTDGPLCPLVT